MLIASGGSKLTYAARCIAALILLLGGLVLVGWYTHNSALIQVNPAFVPMQYNTALGFVLCALGLAAFSLERVQPQRLFGVLASVLGLATLSQYFLGFDLGIDQLFMEHYIDVNTSHPGRMAPNTALCFTLSGFALVIAGVSTRNDTLLSASGYVGAVVFALGVVAFGGYAAGVETAYGWGALTKMAVHTAVGFMLMGAGLLMQAINVYRRVHDGNLPPWLPWSTAIAGLTITVSAWQAARSYEQQLVEQLGFSGQSADDESLLVLGFLATVSFSLWLRSKASAVRQAGGQEQNLATIAVLSLGIALSVGMHQVLDGIHKANVLNRFKAASQEHVQSIRQGFQFYFDTLYDVRGFFESSEYVTRDEFKILTRRDVRALPGIELLSWSPLVEHAEREAFERGESEWRGFPAPIVELNSKSELTEAAERAQYFPVRYFEPVERNIFVHGFDLAVMYDLEPYLSSQSYRVRLSRRIDLENRGLDGYSVVALLPVSTGDGLKGVLGMELKLDKVIGNILQTLTRPAGLNLAFTDLDATDGREQLHTHLSRVEGSKTLKNPLTLELPLTIAGRNWQVTTEAASAELYGTWSSSNLVLPMALLLATLALVVYLRRSVQREQERVALLAELASREKHFSALVATVPGTAYTSAPDDNRSLVFVSHEIEQLTGYDPLAFTEGLVQLAQFIHPDDRAMVSERIGQALARQQPYTMEYRVLHRDGAERWVHEKGAAQFSSAGEAEELHGTIIDITDRKQGEARFKGLLESAPDCMVIVNEEGRISFINQQTELSFGYSTEELLGEPIEKLLPERFRAEHPSLRKNYFADPRVRVMAAARELAVLTREGREIPVEISLSPLRTSSGLLVSAAIRDITERKRMEEEIIHQRDRAEEATRAKSEFLANMSHEIRTPMNSIIGMSHLALQTDLEPRQRNYVEKVHRSAESLLNIINSILDFSKIEAGKLELEEVSFGLDHVLHNLVNVLGLQAEGKGLELLFDIPTDLPLELIGDPYRLEQVLLNLGSNAIKFTEKGEVVIAVKILDANPDEVDIEFSVKDTGIGMSAEEQEKLFQPFSQADSSTTRRFGGTGLGLTICKLIVDRMGGEIALSSHPGRGSQFTFSARFRIDQSNARKRRMPPRDISGLNVLVVDDNAASREILTTVLSSFGFNTRSCSSGELAVDVMEASRETPFDLVILDWKMPGIDGVETARRINDLAGAEAPTCIMVTAYGREEAAEAAAGEGVCISSFLTKPVTPSSLLEAIMLSLGRATPTTSDAGRLVADTLQWTESLAGARILLVEDNELNQELAIELLTMNGIEVDLASNGLEAIQKLDAGVYDGVLMDCQMPVMDGYVATQRLRQDPRFTDLPILAMTANVMAGDREKALAAGMNDQISKPVNPELMFRCMAKWITPGAGPGQPLPEQGSTQGRVVAAISEADIPSLDQALGLSHCHDRPELYHRVLAKFVSQYNVFTEDFSRALLDSDPDAATRYAHSLKGSAGTIGALEVQQQAAALEKACRRSDQAQIQALSKILASRLARVIGEIEPVIAAAEAAVELPLEDIGEKVQTIHKQVLAADSGAIEALEQLLEFGLPAALRENLVPALDRVSEFEFEQAAGHLETALLLLRHPSP